MIEKPSKVMQIGYLNDFRCIADKCSDSCCVSWTIAVTPENKALYDKEAPDVANAVEAKSGGGYQMKKHKTLPGCDCRWYTNGLCGVQQKYGETFLPDICRTFPRSHRRLDNRFLVTANLACPETVRIALYSDKKDAFAFPRAPITQPYTKPNVPNAKRGEFKNTDNEKLFSLFNYTTAQLDDERFTADEAMARLVVFGRDLDDIPPERWLAVKEQLFKQYTKAYMAEKTAAVHKRVGLVLAGEAQDDPAVSHDDWLRHVRAGDVLQTVLDFSFGLVHRDRPRYTTLLHRVREQLGEQGSIIANYTKIKARWEAHYRKELEPVLKNLIKALVSYHLFPVACGFEKKSHTIVTIAMHYLVVKVFLMCCCTAMGRVLEVREVVDVVQPLSKRIYVRNQQQLYAFCVQNGWDKPDKVMDILLHF